MKNNETLAKWMKTRTYKKKPMAQRRGYKPMTHFMVQYKIHGKPLGELLRINIKISVDKIKKALVEFSLMNNQAFKRYHDDLIDAFKFMMQTVKNKEYIFLNKDYMVL